MADTDLKAAESAEKAYAAASEKAPSAPPAEKPKTVVVAKVQTKPKPAAKKAVKKAPVKSKVQVKATAKPATPPAPKTAAEVKPAAKPATPVTAPKPQAAKVQPSKKARSVPKAPPKPKVLPKAKAKPSAPVAKKPVTAPKPQNSKPKEPIFMATSTDFTAPITEAMVEMQDKAKAAYEKSTVMASEMGDFAKGNMEAVVETGKILSSAMQNMGKSAVDEAKSAFETMTADMKEMAAIKSPTELFQLQSKLARRNFDAFIAYGSKASENMLKLSNDAMAPLSSRMSTAAEMATKVG